MKKDVILESLSKLLDGVRSFRYKYLNAFKLEVPDFFYSRYLEL